MTPDSSVARRSFLGGLAASITSLLGGKGKAQAAPTPTISPLHIGELTTDLREAGPMAIMNNERLVHMTPSFPMVVEDIQEGVAEFKLSDGTLQRGWTEEQEATWTEERMAESPVWRVFEPVGQTKRIAHAVKEIDGPERLNGGYVEREKITVSAALRFAAPYELEIPGSPFSIMPDGRVRFTWPLYYKINQPPDDVCIRIPWRTAGWKIQQVVPVAPAAQQPPVIDLAAGTLTDTRPIVRADNLGGPAR